jgi:hypothetical protein
MFMLPGVALLLLVARCCVSFVQRHRQLVSLAAGDFLIDLDPAKHLQGGLGHDGVGSRSAGNRVIASSQPIARTRR